MREHNSEEIKDLILNKNAYFYMCGALEMGKAVETLMHVILDDPEGKYLHQMKEDGRYAKELW